MSQPSPSEHGVAEGPLNRPLSHLGYVVADIPRAVDFWTREMKAGPFYLLDHIDFDTVSFEGRRATYLISVAFGQWGKIVVELQQFHEIDPAKLREKVDIPMNHIAYVCPDAAADSARLSASGMPMYLEATFGPIHVRFHEVAAVGHSIELHQSGDFVDGFFAGLEREAADWDGSEPLREGPP